MGITAVQALGQMVSPLTAFSSSWCARAPPLCGAPRRSRLTMASNVLSDFVDNVLPSIADYEKAEDELSEAYRQSGGDATVAINGLADRGLR